MTESVPVTVHVRSVTPTLGKGKVLALASVEVSVGGIAFGVDGVQVIQTKDPVTGADGTGVDVPRYRAPDGVWRQAVQLPEDLRKPLAQAVLDVCCEMGLAQRRSRLKQNWPILFQIRASYASHTLWYDVFITSTRVHVLWMAF
jgi:DNA-binding cell septation regulator SpoVG